MFNLPDHDPYGNGLTMTPQMHLDAVEHQLTRAWCLQDVTAVESDLWDAHKTRMRLGVLRPWINTAFAMCSQRRDEIVADGDAAQPAHSGNNPSRT